MVNPTFGERYTERDRDRERERERETERQRDRDRERESGLTPPSAKYKLK
jgi:hypothetical protein